MCGQSLCNLVRDVKWAEGGENAENDNSAVAKDNAVEVGLLGLERVWVVSVKSMVSQS